MAIDKAPSCDDPVDNVLLPVEIARARLLDALDVVSENENINLRDAGGRVLAADVVSPIDVPGFTNSAMDGYAVTSSDIPASGERDLTLVGTSWAGQPYSGAIEAGQCVRIFTGGLMPAGSDTVVIQEHVAVSDDLVTIDSAVQAGRNVRQAGEDVQTGQIVLSKGKQLRASELGLLASLGIDTVNVTRRLRVAFFTTGDELRSLETHAGQTLDAGSLFDSNRYTLNEMLSAMGVDVIDMGIVRDSADDTRDAMAKAAAQADVIVTSGGISTGDADFVTKVFHEMGSVAFWKLAMRPGRPLAFGQIGNAHFFGLPGNPVAVIVTFLQFVQPALKHLMGMQHVQPLTMKAACLSKLKKALGRVEYH
jgi:molybdopterin molybdotransferase